MEERADRYRWARHAARVSLRSSPIHIAFSFDGSHYTQATPFLRRINLVHMVMVLAAAVAAHLFFRRLEGDKLATQKFLQHFHLGGVPLSPKPK